MFKNYRIFTSEDPNFVFAIRTDPDEIPHYAAFHQGLHCLQKKPFSCFQSTKG